VILRAAERLHALAVLRAGLVDVVRDRRGADEADRLYLRMREQRIDDDLVALHDVEDAIGQTGFLEQIGHEQRRRRIALARLQNERVARRDRDREHPARHHARKVERRDARDDAERLARRPVVHARRDLFGVVALQQLRNAACEFDHVDAARHFTLRIREDLAVLGGDDRGEFVAMLVHQFEELQHDARAADRRRVAPGRERGFRARDGCIDIGGFTEHELARTLARRGIEHRLRARGRAMRALAVNVMNDVGGIVERLHAVSSHGTGLAIDTV